MGARTLMVPLVLLCLVTGCGGNGDKESASSSSSSSSSSTGGTSASGDSGSGSESGSGGNSDKASSSPSQKVDDKGAPGAPDKQGRQTVVFSRVDGNKSGACVAVGKKRDVRSGGFVGGPFDDARASYGKARPGFKPKEIRLYWVPEHSKPMNGVKVTATSGGKTVKVSRKLVSDAEQWKYYDTRIVLPTGGSWTFRVSSGSDKGCFSASF